MAILHEKYIVDEKGKKSAVILPIEEYNELIEDIHDLTIIAERRNEKELSLDELKQQLKK
jgi:PHD/YefM family antitoxin component YafN of YafNO toxin-antitoxin module